MIGRIVGFLAGAAIAATGYGMLKPATFARYVDLSRVSLGPFAEYRTIVCWLIVAAGAVVALAALQRPSGGGRKRASPVTFETAEAGPSVHGHGPLNLGPEPDEAQDDDDDHQVDHHEIHAPEPSH